MTDRQYATLVNGKLDPDQVPDDVEPGAHKTSHQNGGSDEISVAGLSGELADPQPPKGHGHTNGDDGGDTLTPQSLRIPPQVTPSQTTNGYAVWDGDDFHLTIGDGSGRKTMMNVGDAPTAHKTTHENGGGDEISIAGLDGTSTELGNHLSDSSDAHDASAVSFSDAGLAVVDADDVQAAIADIDAAFALNLFVGPIYAAVPMTQIAVPTANHVYAQAFQVSRPVTVSTAHFVVGTQSGNMDIAVLAANGDRLGSTGSFAVPATSSASQALTGSVNLVPGLVYYSALACDNTTATFSAFNYGVGNNNVFLGAMGFLRKASAGSLPIPAINSLGTGTMRPYSIAFT